MPTIAATSISPRIAVRILIEHHPWPSKDNHLRTDRPRQHLSWMVSVPAGLSRHWLLDREMLLQVGHASLPHQKTTLCGHPKQGIQGEQNQSLANRLEVGFLGRFDLEVVST